MNKSEVCELLTREVNAVIDAPVRCIKDTSYNKQQKKWRVEIKFDIKNPISIRDLMKKFSQCGINVSPDKLAIPYSFTALKAYEDVAPEQ